MNALKTLLPVFVLAGCATEMAAWDADRDASLERSSKARVQLVHLSPDAPPVDLVLGGERRVLRELAYMEATGSKRVAPGDYALDIPASGGVDPVISADLSLDARTSYTIVAWDELSMIKPAVLVNTLDGLEDGFTRLQVTHTAVGVGTVDIWDLGSGVKLVDDFEFGATGVLDVPAAAYDIGLDLDEDAVPDVTFSVPDLGADTTVNVFPVADDMGVALVAVYVDGTVARVDAD